MKSKDESKIREIIKKETVSREYELGLIKIETLLRKNKTEPEGWILNKLGFLCDHAAWEEKDSKKRKRMKKELSVIIKNL